MLTCLHFVMYDTLGHYFPSFVWPEPLNTRHFLVHIRSSLAVVIWRSSFGALTLASQLLMMKTVYFLFFIHTHTQIRSLCIHFTVVPTLIARLKLCVLCICWKHVIASEICKRGFGWLEKVEGRVCELYMRRQEWQQIITREKLFTIDHTLYIFRKTI